MNQSRSFKRSSIAGWITAICLLNASQGVFSQDAADLAELVETRNKAPILKAAAAYEVKDNVAEIELSEYAGYAGLIVANGGLEPNEDSFFNKEYGFKVKLTLSEEESWSALNSGKLAGSATTVDVLAAYGGQFKVKVPALIGFSRGATGLILRNDYKKINDLKGKIVSVCQFTEGDFFIRYLAQEAGLEIAQLSDPPWRPDPDKLNLVFCADGFGAGDLFERDVRKKLGQLAGCVTWDPKTGDVAEACNGAAYIITTTANLLVVADVLVLNEGFAATHPKIVEGLVHGMLMGNSMVRSNPAEHAPVIEEAFGWDAGEAIKELKKVHLANLPENLAFFDGSIDSAGSFKYLLETGSDLYRAQLASAPISKDSVISLEALKIASKAGAFGDQKADITPIKIDIDLGESDISDTLLSKNIRIEFMPNSADVEPGKSDAVFEQVAQLMRVGSGSKVKLRGHADNLKLESYRNQPGHDPNKLRAGELKLKALSEDRCASVSKLLVEKLKVDAARIDVEGVGVAEATGDAEFDRRVEVLWFTK